ncbi:MAG: DUF1572 domain-containing protein [Bacteroidetes bacterium]|nr:DUF1572 domain-containing protein [Bacteroidota bacterium]
MLKESLVEVLNRDINKLKIEIELYEDESKLWVIENDIKNSGGNLALHLVGSLKHFIGNILGGIKYNRDRDGEFSKKNIPRKELLNEIEETKEIVVKTINSLDENDFNKIYPVEVFNKKMTTIFFLIHITTHLNYHLGQINYHRRILSK